jgi:hypothetical protein
MASLNRTFILLYTREIASAKNASQWVKHVIAVPVKIYHCERAVCASEAISMLAHRKLVAAPVHAGGLCALVAAISIAVLDLTVIPTCLGVIRNVGRMQCGADAMWGGCNVGRMPSAPTRMGVNGWVEYLSE